MKLRQSPMPARALRHEQPAAVKAAEPVSRYHPVLVILHWTLAFLIVGALAGGALKIAPLANTNPMKAEGLRVHMSGGILILTLMCLRTFVRRFTSRPPRAGTGQPLLDRLARFSHLSFYGIVIAMATSGLIMGLQTGVIGFVAGGQPPMPADFWAYPIRRVHYVLSRVLIGLIAVHLSGVIYHTFIRRDRLLRRMAFGKRLHAPDPTSLKAR